MVSHTEHSWPQRLPGLETDICSEPNVHLLGSPWPFVWEGAPFVKVGGLFVQIMRGICLALLEVFVGGLSWYVQCKPERTQPMITSYHILCEKCSDFFLFLFANKLKEVECKCQP